MKYRVLYDRVFNNHNKQLIYNNRIVAGLSFYVRIKIKDQNGKDLFLRRITDNDYEDITTDFFHNIQFSIDKQNLLFSICIYKDIYKCFIENKNIEYIKISLTDFSIDLFTDNDCWLSEKHIVSEKEFVNFLIDNHIDFEIYDNIRSQNCAYTLEEVI